MLAGTIALPNTVKELNSQLLSAEAHFSQKPARNNDRSRKDKSDRPSNRLLECCNKMDIHKKEHCSRFVDAGPPRCAAQASVASTFDQADRMAAALTKT